jgi:MFS transporter, OFA family, oxalate/formate antiporter
VSGAFAVGTAPWALSVLLSPMETELGWSRSTVFGALTLRSLLSGMLAPFLWPYMDRPKGPLVLSMIGAVSLGGSLMGLRYVQEPWQFYMLFGVVGSVSMLGSGFFLAQTVVPKWFLRKRGRALGLATMGTGAGAFFPLFIHPILEAIGWRDTWFVMGVAGLVILAPLAALMRRQPEDLGLLPDGATEQARALTGPGASQRPSDMRIHGRSLTRQEVVRRPVFWLIVLILGLGGLGLQGYQPNWIPYLTDSGISPATASYAMSIYAVFSILFRVFLWGYLADRFPARYLLTAQAAIITLTVVILLNVDSTPRLVAFAAISGMGIGGWVMLQPLIVADYFGRGHLGAINGVMRPILTLSTAAGPLVIAGMYDGLGSYFWAFILVLAFWAAMGLIALVTKPPVRALPPE